MSEILVQSHVSETNNISCKSNNCLIIKKRKLSKTKILKKCVTLCDDLINFIFTFIGFQGIQDFKRNMLKESVYEKFKEYRFHLHAKYTNKAREICTIINKLTNYGIVVLAKEMNNYPNLFTHLELKDEWKIDNYKNKIIQLYQELCKKTLLREDYEFKMKAWGVPIFKKAWAHFLTFEYPYLNHERKNYLPLFTDIMNISIQYSL